jgi:ribulose kinase
MKRAWYKRAAGLKWNLHFCMTSLDMFEKHGIDPDKLHGAGYDAWCTSLLFEELRQVLETGRW